MDFSEKFLSADDAPVITNAQAFIPFSFGPANCAGKNMAMLEMRILTALLVHKFELKFADGHDPHKWEDSMEDLFVVKLSEMPVTVSRR